MQVRAILTSIVLLAGLGAALPSPAQTSADQLILDMQQAARRGDKARLASLLPQVRGHVLEPWAAYWEARSRLEDFTSADMQAFSARYFGSYQEDRLRNDWLLLLGQRRDWTTFAAEHPQFRMGDDRQVRCYALLVDQLRSNQPATQAVADDVRRLWLAQRDADDGCTQAADRLYATKRLPAEDVWRKARLSVEANRGRAARDAVQIVAPEALDQVGQLLDSPVRYLAGRAIAASKLRRELITLALVKLAASDPDQAAAALDGKWSVQLTAEERNWLWGTIGKQAAIRRSPSTWDYFDKVQRDTDLHDEMLAWKARTALREGQWKALTTTIQAMGDDSRLDPTWIYWRARALQKIGSEADRAEALQLYDSIASVRGFYEQLALEELGRRIEAPPAPPPPTPDEKALARANPSLQRALYAIGIGLRSEGVREWNYATNLHAPGGMAERDLLAAADLACERQVWDRCINTSERTRQSIDFSQRFPMPLQDSVVPRSRAIGLDPAFVYGLIRQESRFIMDARSHVGASGLMQVMPATARWTARKIGLNDFTPGQINDRETNIAIGTGYLKLVLDDFAGSMPMAAAAYNAGPGRPRVWRGQAGAPTLEAAIWAENIPFTETRDYVKKVVSNATNYAAILTGQPQSLKARMGTVGPLAAGAPDPSKELP
ncbi:lytic transglycosylase domain-containing protein [Pseudorhodoferax sp. Leaf274]|uniref:lytic transglycosylase domain-containing protein n=1 Tax=Pseudorhodoferax sp. Leaf274 TaxID=1736318 RepID=UPI0007026410|nr:lytic transglycosylase domain-containing protein [Pseudorhodoferax sp. Leaf274]KQP46127.1 lytic transglycosylase [Pseudorhodoferax sp. Leaf274]